MAFYHLKFVFYETIFKGFSFNFDWVLQNPASLEQKIKTGQNPLKSE